MLISAGVGLLEFQSQFGSEVTLNPDCFHSHSPTFNWHFFAFSSTVFGLVGYGSVHMLRGECRVRFLSKMRAMQCKPTHTKIVSEQDCISMAEVISSVKLWCCIRNLWQKILMFVLAIFAMHTAQYLWLGLSVLWSFLIYILYMLSMAKIYVLAIYAKH